MSSANLRIGCILVFVWIFACSIRLSYLSFVDINSDSLSSYLAALRFWRLGYSPPPNPESDHWMWISKIPWFWSASSLEDLFRIRFYIGSTIAPMAAWCVWFSSKRYRYISALACGMLVALDKGLIDTLISSFRGYMAPEWISVATVLFVLSHRHTRALPWIGVFVVIASGHHPMAFGGLLGVLWLCRKNSRYICWIALGVLCASIFRCLSLYQIMQCDEGGWACVRTIALGSTDNISVLDTLIRIFHDRFWVEMGWSCGFLFLGFVLSPRGTFWKWCVFSCLGVVVLGFTIETLRPYHFRSFLLPMLIVSIHGLQKLRFWSIPLMISWVIGLWFSSADIVGHQNQIQRHDKAARSIQQYAYPIWMESLEGSSIFVPGVGLSSILSGFSADYYATEPGAVLYIFSKQGIPTPKNYNRMMEGVEWGGGHDWATSIYVSDRVKIP